MEARNTVLQQKRLEVEQLRREAAMKRIPVSQALEDIKTYIRDHGQEDCLVVGFQGKNSNPYREKSSCQVLWWELPNKYVLALTGKNAQLLDIILLQLTPYQVFEFQTCVFISFEETSEILINADRFWQILTVHKDFP